MKKELQNKDNSQLKLLSNVIRENDIRDVLPKHVFNCVGGIKFLLKFNYTFEKLTGLEAEILSTFHHLTFISGILRIFSAKTSNWFIKNGLTMVLHLNTEGLLLLLIL